MYQVIVIVEKIQKFLLPRIFPYPYKNKAIYFVLSCILCAPNVPVGNVYRSRVGFSRRDHQ